MIFELETLFPAFLTRRSSAAVHKGNSDRGGPWDLPKDCKQLEITKSFLAEEFPV